MNVVISNNIIIDGPTPEIIKWCENNLVVNNPVYTQLKLRNQENIIKIRHVPEKLNLHSYRRGQLILPFGCLYAVWPMIKNTSSDIKLDFNNAGDISVKNDTCTLTLRDYQVDAVEKMLKAKGGILVSPCGSGKTTMGIEIIRRIGKKALWLCHTTDLLTQTKDAMLKNYPNFKIGLTTDGKVEIGDDVTIATVQTMDKIDPELYKNEFDVVVCDESAHVASAPTQMKMFGRVLSNIKARYKFGLTATPDRSDGMIKAMYCYIGLNPNGIIDATVKISKDKVKTMPSIHQRVDIYTGCDTDESILSLYDSSGMIIYNDLIQYLVNKQERNEKIVDNIYKCYKEGRKQVVLTLRVEHCEIIEEMLKSKGIRTAVVTGKVATKKRKQILKEEIEWDILIATFQLLKEGIDILTLDTLHMILPIKDKGTVVQCAGRIERYLEGKKQPITYDYVDTDIAYCEKKYIDRRRALKRRF